MWEEVFIDDNTTLKCSCLRDSIRHVMSRIFHAPAKFAKVVNLNLAIGQATIMLA